MNEHDPLQQYFADRAPHVEVPSAGVATIARRGRARRHRRSAVRIGAVVDYLDLHWRDMHWPAFNLADIFIVGSAALLALASFRVCRCGWHEELLTCRSGGNDYLSLRRCGRHVRLQRPTVGPGIEIA